MGLDKANIFKLNDEEQAMYKKEPFLDCFESTKAFAKDLMQDIGTKETPHSLLLSADYGMGKTFFSTRFTQYLRKNHYDVIYFSVWENDYMNEPFLAFSKVIVNYINNKFQYEKYKDNMKNLFEGIEKVISSISLSFFGGAISISSKELLDNFKDTDPIINFRKQLTSFITKIPKKKLVIIVDELDRCRPDYAMKTLECIKHFFDIEGLFIIIPTNTNALNDCIKSLYGIDNCGRKSKENYFQKFFNDERTIKKPTQEDYLYIVNQYLTRERLQEALNNNLLSENNDRYNSYEKLKSYFAQYAYNARLTVRELKDFSIELARICNNFYEPIRAEWLCCLMANRNKEKDANYIYPVPRENCFYKEKYKNLNDTPNGRNELFKLNNYYSVLRNIKQISYIRDRHGCPIEGRNYYNLINAYINTTQGNLNFTIYQDIFNHLKKVQEALDNVKAEYSNCPVVMTNLDIVQNAIDSQINATNNYQNNYGSDDNDYDRREKYIKIIENLEQLYSIHQ